MSVIKPSDKLKELQDYTSSLSQNVGVDFFDPQPKPNVKMLLSTVVSLAWQGLVITTVINDLPSRTILTLAFVHLSFFSQGIIRTVNVAINPFTTSKLRDQTLEFYKTKEIDPILKPFLLRTVNRTEKVSKLFVFFLAFIFNSNILLLILALFTGVYVLLVPIYFPYTNPQTLLGYLANILPQIGMGCVGFFTFSAYDATILIYGLHSWTLTDLFKTKLRNFNQELESIDRLRDMILMDVKIKGKLIEIMKEYDELREYMTEYGKLFRWPFTIAVCVNLFGIFLCLDFGLTVSFDMAFGASLGLFIQLLLPAITGGILTIQRYRVNSEINNLSWDLLQTTTNMKIFKQFLMFQYTHDAIKIPLFGVADLKLILKILCFLYFVAVFYANLIWFVGE